ncbi:hypothetical protein BC826DRAFT_175157 [Russula brevipes]|nr:hypothetical protein BC826DRAFT_175157 [Russula brevipes]
MFRQVRKGVSVGRGETVWARAPHNCHIHRSGQSVIQSSLRRTQHWSCNNPLFRPDEPTLNATVRANLAWLTVHPHNPSLIFKSFMGMKLPNGRHRHSQIRPLGHGMIVVHMQISWGASPTFAARDSRRPRHRKRASSTMLPSARVQVLILTNQPRVDAHPVVWFNTAHVWKQTLPQPRRPPSAPRRNSSSKTPDGSRAVLQVK